MLNTTTRLFEGNHLTKQEKEFNKLRALPYNAKTMKRWHTLAVQTNWAWAYYYYAGGALILGDLGVARDIYDGLLANPGLDEAFHNQVRNNLLLMNDQAESKAAQVSLNLLLIDDQAKTKAAQACDKYNKYIVPIPELQKRHAYLVKEGARLIAQQKQIDKDRADYKEVKAWELANRDVVKEEDVRKLIATYNDLEKRQENASNETLQWARTKNGITATQPSSRTACPPQGRRP